MNITQRMADMLTVMRSGVSHSATSMAAELSLPRNGSIAENLKYNFGRMIELGLVVVDAERSNHAGTSYSVTSFGVAALNSHSKHPQTFGVKSSRANVMSKDYPLLTTSNAGYVRNNGHAHIPSRGWQS